MIVKNNAASVSIIFLKSAPRRQLSITSFIYMSVAVVTRKTKTPFLTKFKIAKLKINAFFHTATVNKTLVIKRK